MPGDRMTPPISRRAVIAAPGVLAGMRGAHAQPAATGPMAAVFARWMAAHGVTSGVVALALEGQLVQLAGFGGADPMARVPVWSLSKFITGLAVARLAGHGRLRSPAQVRPRTEGRRQRPLDVWAHRRG